MSATTFFRAQNRGSSGPSVVKLVKYYESLSATSSLLLRGTRDGGAGQVARPLRPRDDREDERTCPARGRGVRQQTPSGHCGSGDHDDRGSGDCDRRNHLPNATRGDQAPSVARFYDRRGIEYASPETRQAYHHRRGHGHRAAGDATASASAATKTAWADGRDSVARVTVFVVVHPGSDRSELYYAPKRAKI